MKVLFIAPYIPNRVRVRPYHWLCSLLQRGHDLTLLAAWSTDEELADIEALRVLGMRVLTQHIPLWRSMTNVVLTLPTRQPLQAAYSVHPALQRTLEATLANGLPDVVHVEHLRGAQYGLQARGNGVSRSPAIGRVPVVWDSVDCISHLFQQAAQHSRSLKGRMIARLDLPRTQRYEGWLVHQFDRVLVTSSADKAALAQLALGADSHPVQLETEDRCRQVDEKLKVLPNGVDLDYFTPGNFPPDSARVVFTGKMSYHANITAANHLVREIMPLVWAHRPDTEVWIVGKDPTPKVRALANESTTSPTSQTNPQGRVVVTGSVPDIRPYLHQAAVAVAPTVYGAGIQNKVLEAMACGTPVIASPQAASALQITPGYELLVANNPQIFAREIINLLDSPDRRAELSERGRSYVKQYHSWQVAAEELEEIYCTAINDRNHF